jgi:hypothetical protein
MPRSEDIERFTEVLNSLGDEPAIRAARSETIEQVAAPGEASSQESGELDSLGLEGEGTEAGSPGEAESLQDIFQSLSALPEAGAEESVPAGDEMPGLAEPEGFEPEAAPGQGPGAAGEGLDFASLFGEETAPEGIEDLEPGNLQADLAQMETLPDDLAEAGLGTGPELETSAPAEAAPPGGGEAFEDLGAFSMDAPAAETLAQPEPDSPEDFTAAGFETPQEGESAGAESFELPTLDDVSFSEPVDGLSSEAAPPAQEPSLDEPLPSFDEPMPSLEEPSLEAPSFEAASPEAASFEEAAPSDVVGEGLSSEFEGAETGAAMDEFPSDLPAADLEGAPEAPVAEDAGMESLGEESLGDLNLDEFSLPASAEQFGMPGAPVEEPQARPAPAARAPEPRLAPGGAGSCTG